ncbi:MAG: heme o synthase [Saprospiraceae bacterium]
MSSTNRTNNSQLTTSDGGLFDGLRDFAMLTKIRLTATVVLSAALAYLVAAPVFDLATFTAIVVGGFGTTMAANTLNQVLEREHDQQMKRTENRPLAKGRMTVSTAVLSAGLLSIVGTISLALINPLAALLGMVALLSYAFVYTPMKRYSVAAVFVGTIPGAIPALIGTVAAAGWITTLGWSLFAIQVLWQIPHFWAIGWLGFDDYKKAGFKLLPVTEDGERDPGTGLQSLVFAIILAAIVWIPYQSGDFSLLATVLSCIMGIVYAGFGYNFWQKCDRSSALKLMFFSFSYLPVVFTFGWLL